MHLVTGLTNMCLHAMLLSNNKHGMQTHIGQACAFGGRFLIATLIFLPLSQGLKG